MWVALHFHSYFLCYAFPNFQLARLDIFWNFLQRSLELKISWAPTENNGPLPLGICKNSFRSYKITLKCCTSMLI